MVFNAPDADVFLELQKAEERFIRVIDSMLLYSSISERFSAEVYTETRWYL